jgi:RNA polymerase sigma-70 factor, ECF subfamily
MTGTACDQIVLPGGDLGVVSRCLQGDPAAWETVVHSYTRKIRRMAERYASVRHEADDLTQEVFSRVYVHLDQFRAETGTLHNWIVRISRNLMIDHLRRSRRSRWFGGSDELESLNLQDTQVRPPDRSVESGEAARIVGAALCCLPDDLRDVLELRYLDDMSYQEIAAHLGVPEGTIKSRISRARTRLVGIIKRQSARKAA